MSLTVLMLLINVAILVLQNIITCNIFLFFLMNLVDLSVFSIVYYYFYHSVYENNDNANCILVTHFNKN